MSNWRLTVKEIYTKGGEVSWEALREFRYTRGIKDAKKYGLVHATGKCGLGNIWGLTTKGFDWCEGRINTQANGPRKMQFVSTWLASLPRGLKLDKGERA